MTNMLLTVSLFLTESGADTSIVKILLISLAVGLIVGLIRAFMLKGQLTSVYKNDYASDYTRKNSFKVSESKDIFLGSKTETFEKPRNDEHH